MITYTELTNETIAFLEINSTDLSKFSVVENLNFSQRELINALPVSSFNNMLKRSVFNLAANVSSYQFPGDFARFKQLKIDYSAAITASNKGKEASVFNSEKGILDVQELGTKNFPFVDLTVEKGFEISPIPTVAVTDGGWLNYVYIPPDISTTQDSMFDKRLKNLLIYKAVSLSALIDNYRPDLHERFKGLYIDAISSLLPSKGRLVNV